MNNHARHPRTTELEVENERLRAEVSVLSQEATHYRTFVERTDDLIIQVDATGAFMYVNPSAERVFGYTPAQCIGMSVFDLVHPDDRLQTEQAFQTWLQNRDQSAILENRLIHHDGRTYHMLWTINLDYDDQGHLQRANAICRDITAYKHQIEQLLQSEALLHGIVDNVPAALFVKDLEGRFLLVNQFAAATLNTDPAHLIGIREADLFRPALAEAIGKKDQQVIRNAMPLASEYRIPMSDGEHSFSSVRFPIRNAQGIIYATGGIAIDITERKQVEQQLRLFQDTLHTTPLAVAMAPVTTALHSYINPAYCQLIGYTPEEFIGMPVTQVFADEPEYIMSLFTQCIAQGTWQGELPYRRKDGTTFPAYLTANVLYDASGAPHTIVGFVQDLTLQKQQEAALRIFRDIVHNTPVAISNAPVTTGLLSYVNPAYCRLLGYREEELIHQPLSFVFAEDPEYINSAFMQCIREGFWQGEIRYRHQDGTVIPTYLTANILYDENGTPDGAAGFVQDLRPQKAQEARLRLFQLLVESAPDGIALTDSSLHITYANPAFEAMFDYQPTVVGRLLEQLVAPEDRPEIATFARRTQAEGAVRGQVRYQRASGQVFTAQFSGLVIRDDTGNVLGFASINRDITELLQAEQERQLLQEQVIAAQQAALRELSTPLMPIAEGVVVMPIIGTIDSTRAQQIMEVLLEGINAHNAEIAILDITGVRVVDIQVAAALLRAAQAARLLGAQVVLSGISAEVAQTLVHIGADLREIVAKQSLQQSIAYALNQRR